VARPCGGLRLFRVLGSAGSCANRRKQRGVISLSHAIASLEARKSPMGRIVLPTGDRVTIREYECRLAEIDRILNDPEVPFEPAGVWALLADIAPVPLSRRRRGTLPARSIWYAISSASRLR
jgi:hypothetical protein